jgi:hypothetical protein
MDFECGRANLGKREKQDENLMQMFRWFMNKDYVFEKQWLRSNQYGVVSQGKQQAGNHVG